MALTGGTLDTDAILKMLRAGGGRATATRRVTIDIILAAGVEHLNAEEILHRVRRQMPDVAESTVYRTLASLEDLGVITHLHLGHGPSTYHQADNAHQHLVCQVCGSITDVPDAVFDGVAAQIDEGYGFAIDPRHFALQGTCRDCRAAGHPNHQTSP
ncbi:MAG: transcriptional repressor [Actinomycetota bacterium]|nr:transcriptional repressor [Actinomycetota bacterium]